MKAKQAREASNWFKFIKTVRAAIGVYSSESLKAAWEKIISAVENGDDSCITYYLPQAVFVALIANGFKIEGETEEQIHYWVIYW